MEIKLDDIEVYRKEFLNCYDWVMQNAIDNISINFPKKDPIQRNMISHQKYYGPEFIKRQKNVEVQGMTILIDKAIFKEEEAAKETIEDSQSQS